MTPVMLLIRTLFFHCALFIVQKEQKMINIATNSELGPIWTKDLERKKGRIVRLLEAKYKVLCWYCYY